MASTLTEYERSAILDKEIERYIRSGYRVVSRTPTTAQLVKPKGFSIIIAFLAFLILIVGLVLYLLWYLAKRDSQVYLTVDERGKVHRR